MTNSTRFFASFLIVLVIGCANTQPPPIFDSPIGNWTEKSEKSSGGTITSRLTIIDEASAKYSGPFNGQVEFYAADDQGTWKGYWIADGHTTCLEEKGGSKSWGETIFHFNETYTRYKGTWDYCGQDQKYIISGVRR